MEKATIKAKRFKKFLKELAEETTSGDIATIDTKLDMVKKPKHLIKGDKCKKHKKLDCETCKLNKEDLKYN